jgi:hypothetical protein
MVIISRANSQQRWFNSILRRLSKIKQVHTDAYPIPKPDEQLNALEGSKYFSSID